MKSPAHASRRCLMTLLCLLQAAAVLAQQDLAEVTIDTVPVRESLYMLSGAGGNIGVLAGSDGMIVIDDQYAPLSTRIRAAIGKLGAQPIRFVLNTHWHDDHTGGNAEFAASGAVVVAQRNVRERLGRGQFITFLQREVAPAVPAALPIITFGDTMNFYLNGQDVHVLHVPAAHTDGDSIVHFPGLNAWHMGDTYFAGMYPFIDGSSGGTLEGCIAAIDRVLGESDEHTLIIPGHGKLSNRAELGRYRAMLATVGERLIAARARGEDDAAIVAGKPTAGFDAAFGGGFIAPDAWVGMLLGLPAAAKP